MFSTPSGTALDPQWTPSAIAGFPGDSSGHRIATADPRRAGAAAPTPGPGSTRAAPRGPFGGPPASTRCRSLRANRTSWLEEPGDGRGRPGTGCRKRRAEHRGGHLAGQFRTPGWGILNFLILLTVFLGCGPEGRSEPALRVGTSGDYAPFSIRGADGGLSGFDVELARAWAADRGRRIELVAFRWPDLTAALRDGRFDVALSGVTVRPDRSAAGRFGVPVAETGAVVLVPADGPQSLPALEAAGARLAVNAGGHLERATREALPGVRPVPVADNGAVLDALAAGGVSGVVTDTLEAPVWEERWRSAGRAPLRRLGPFTRDRKAPWWRDGADAEARDLDAWLLEREADGGLAALRARYFGAAAGGPTATPWRALLAAIDERLALMPAVAAAKRARGAPIEVPEVEARVVRAGLADVEREARAAGRPAPDPAAARAVFEALIEAAKAAQRAAPDAPPSLDLDTALRPALLRIGDRIAFLLVRLPADPPPVDEWVRDLESGTGLGALGGDHARRLGETLHRAARERGAP